jgi:hypothetical protein
LSFSLPTFPYPLSCKKPRTRAQQQRPLDPRIKHPIAVGVHVALKETPLLFEFFPAHLSLPTFSRRKKLNVDHTLQWRLFLACLARDSDTEGDVCHRQVHHKSWTRTFQSRRQLCARTPFNQEGNFVRAPLSIKKATLCVRPFQSRRQLCAHDLFNLSSNFNHSSLSYYSLCALFIMCIIHLCALFYISELNINQRKLKESFAHKAPVAFNCKLRFNDSIT